MDGALLVLTLVAAVGCAVNGGIFFTFSTFTMAGLKRMPPADGMAAMQSINVTAVTPPFMTVLFGTGLLCLAVVVAALAAGEPLAAAGAAVYVAGAIAVTIAANVPLNDRLAAAGPSETAVWAHYADRWTAWNHVRTLSGVAAAALLIVAAL